MYNRSCCIKLDKNLKRCCARKRNLTYENGVLLSLICWAKLAYVTIFSFLMLNLFAGLGWLLSHYLMLNLFAGLGWLLSHYLMLNLFAGLGWLLSHYLMLNLFAGLGLLKIDLLGTVTIFCSLSFIEFD